MKQYGSVKGIFVFLTELHGDYVSLMNLRKKITFVKLHFPWEKTELCIYLYGMVYEDTVWFINVTNNIYMVNNLIRDSYGNCVLAWQHYLKAHFSEKDSMVKYGYIYKVNKKHFTESILYPLVPFYDTPKELYSKMRVL